jgi:hypothetical protein
MTCGVSAAAGGAEGRAVALTRSLSIRQSRRR